MIIKREKLESYRDLLINHDKLTENGRINLWKVKIDAGEPINVSPEHITRLLGKFRIGKISEDALLKWVYTLRWTDLFYFCEEYRDSMFGILDSIAQRVGDQHNDSGLREINIMKVVNGIEQVKLSKPITAEDIEYYIDALQKNIEI